MLTLSQVIERCNGNGYGDDAAFSQYLSPALAALPEGSYAVVDLETDYDLLLAAGLDDDQLLDQMAGYPTVKVAEWGCTPEHGYGWLEQLTTPSGPGVSFTFGGSPMNSAFGIYVVPAAEVPGYPE